MKTLRSILCLLIVSIALVGCTTTRTDKVQTEDPPGSGTFVETLVTNHIVDPRLEAYVNIGREAAKASAAVNPFAPLIDYGLYGLLLIAGFIAKRKNDQAKLKTTLLETVIQGVENAAVTSTSTKESIQRIAEIKGVEPELSLLVNQITR